MHTCVYIDEHMRLYRCTNVYRCTHVSICRSIVMEIRPSGFRAAACSHGRHTSRVSGPRKRVSGSVIARSGGGGGFEARTWSDSSSNIGVTEWKLVDERKRTERERTGPALAGCYTASRIIRSAGNGRFEFRQLFSLVYVLDSQSISLTRSPYARITRLPVYDTRGL